MLVTVSIEARTSAHVDGYPAEMVSASKKLSLSLDGTCEDIVSAVEEFVGARLGKTTADAVNAAQYECEKAVARLTAVKVAQPEFEALRPVSVTSAPEPCSPPKEPPPAAATANQPNTPAPAAAQAVTPKVEAKK